MSRDQENYGGDVDYTGEERKAWIRGYLWALEHIQDQAVGVDLANLRKVQAVQVMVVPYPKAWDERERQVG